MFGAPEVEPAFGSPPADQEPSPTLSVRREFFISQLCGWRGLAGSLHLELSPVGSLVEPAPSGPQVVGGERGALGVGGGVGDNFHRPQGWRKGLPQARGTWGGCWPPPSAVRAEDSGMAGGCPVLGVFWGTTGIWGRGSGLGGLCRGPGACCRGPGRSL